MIAVASGGMELKMETVSMCLRGQLVAVGMHEINSWYNNYGLFQHFFLHYCLLPLELEDETTFYMTGNLVLLPCLVCF